MCGGVRFEIDAPLAGAGYCHCTRCQRRTGTAASASARIEPGSLRVLHGAQLLRAWRPPDDPESFPKVFCSECGSHLWSEHPQEPELKFVRFGSFDADPGIRPTTRQFTAYAASWEPIPDDGLPRYPERRPPGT